MAIIGDALRQAFMHKHEYASLRDEDKAWIKLQRPIIIFFLTFITLLIFISTAIGLKIVFPNDPEIRPFCTNLPPKNATSNEDVHLTDQQIVDYYWTFVFVPSVVIFLLSAIYLVAGIIVAYTAPTRHGCIKVVENNYCAPNRGGVRCLFILNFMFAITFSFLAIYLGSSLFSPESSCSIPLFWCYEFQSWGLVTLYGVTASLVRRKAAMVLDDGELGGQIIGIEMIEVIPVEFTPDMERRINEGFRSWMGTTDVSSDDEDEYQEFPHLSHTNSYR